MAPAKWHMPVVLAPSRSGCGPGHRNNTTDTATAAILCTRKFRVISFETYQVHVDGCGFRPSTCNRQCGEVVLLKDVGWHALGVYQPVGRDIGTSDVSLLMCYECMHGGSHPTATTCNWLIASGHGDICRVVLSNYCLRKESSSSWPRTKPFMSIPTRWRVPMVNLWIYEWWFMNYSKTRNNLAYG